MYITVFAGAPCAKTVSFFRNLSTFLPRPAESRNNFTSKAGLLEFALVGERGTLGDTCLGADGTMRQNSMEPDAADCTILNSQPSNLQMRLLHSGETHKSPGAGNRFSHATVDCPSHPFRSSLRLIEREGKEKQLLVALDLQSDRRSRWQSLERTTQTIQRGHGLAIQRANHVSGVQRHFHTSPRRASGNDNPKRVTQFRHHRGNSLINLQPENPQCRHKIFL